MSKKLVTLLMVLLLFGMLLGCQSRTTDEEASANGTDSGTEEMVSARLEGSFTVTVREVLPNYVLDDTTMFCAVVTYFQAPPFILEVGERASELEIGKAYTFTIKETHIGLVPASEVGREISYLEATVKYSSVEIEDFREATEGEGGISGPEITIAEVK